MAATLAMAALTGCSSSGSSGAAGKGSSPSTAPSTSSSAPTAQAAPRSKADVRITKAGVEDDPVRGPHAYVVHYTVTNHGAGAADCFAQLEFLDADGDHLGNTGITADTLGAGKSKTGDAAPLDVEIQNGKIADIRSVRVTEVDRTPSS
ncbi:hypothetical protein ABZX65_25305 [Streptomyces sp. NPDC003300]|uniref:hypothetical protein n=1 Tax=unclassified Streptomyces TaxID=2593676 RepID=UPI0033A84B61